MDSEGDQKKDTQEVLSGGEDTYRPGGITLQLSQIALIPQWDIPFEVLREIFAVDRMYYRKYKKAYSDLRAT